MNNSQDQNFSDNKITTGSKLSPGSKSDSNKLTIVGSFVLGLVKSSAKGGFVTEDKHNQIVIKNSYFGGNSGESGGVFFLDGTDGSNNINLDANNRFENTIENSIFEKNKAIGDGVYDGGGGAIDSSNIVTIKNSEFRENSSYHNGGAVQLSQRGSSTITGSLFEGNESGNANSASDGGAIYLNDADGDLLNRNVTINNAHFIQNEAVGKGGAIYVNRNETVTISNTKFEGNKATNGAAININKGTVLIDENVTFDDNEGAEDIYFSGSSGNLEFNDFGEITLENGISAASSSDAFIVTLSSNSSDSQLKIGKDSDSILKNVAVELGDKTKLSIETNTDTSLSDLILNSGSTLDLTYDVRDLLDNSSKINTIATNNLTINADSIVQVDSVFDKTQGVMDSISVSNSLNANETITIDADIILKEDFNDDTFSMNSNSFITEPNGYNYKIDIVDRFVAPESLAKNYVYKATESLAGHEIKLEKFASITGLPNAIANGSVSEYTLSSPENIYLWGVVGGYNGISSTLTKADGTIQAQDFTIKGAGNTISFKNFANGENLPNLSGFVVKNGNKLTLDNVTIESPNLLTSSTITLNENSDLDVINSNFDEVKLTSGNTISIGGNSSIDNIEGTNDGSLNAQSEVILSEDSMLVSENINKTNIELKEQANLSVSEKLDLSNSTLTVGNDSTVNAKDLLLANSTVDLQNGKIDTINLSGELNATASSDIKIDVDISSGVIKADSITGNNTSTVALNVIVSNNDLSEDLAIGTMSAISNAIVENSLGVSGNSVNFVDANGNAITDTNKNYISSEKYLYTLNQGTSTNSNKLVLSKEAMISGVAADISNTDVSKSIVKGDTQLDIWGAVKDSNGDYIKNNGVINHDITIEGDTNDSGSTSETAADIISSYFNGANALTGFTVAENNTLTIKDIEGLNRFKDYSVKLENDADLVLDNTILNNSQSDPSHSDVLLTSNNTITVNSDSTVSNITSSETISGDTLVSNKLILSGIPSDNTELETDNISGVQISLDNAQLTVNKTLNLSNSILVVGDNSKVDMSATGTTLRLSNSEIKLNKNNQIDNIAVNNLEVSNNLNLALDADLANTAIDSIEASNLSVDSNSTIKITDVNILSDLAVGENEVALSPLDGLQKISSSIFDISAIGIGNSGDGKVLSGKYVYKLSVLDDGHTDEKLLFTKIGSTNADDLTGLPKAIYDKSSLYSMTGDENISAWLADSSTGQNDGGKLLADITVKGNGFDIEGNSNAGLVVNENRTLTLEDVANLGGFKSADWEGGSIHNEGTTKVVANNSDVNFGLSTDSTGNNAIYNTGDLYLTTDSDSSITFTDNASITGSTTDRGTIYTNGNVNLDDVSNNNIVVESGSLSFKDLSLDDSLSLRAEYDDQNTTGVKITGETIAVTSGQKSEIDLQNGNTKDELSVNNVSGDVNLKLDASLSGNGSIDKVTLNNVLGKVYIPEDGVNISSDMDYGKHSILLNAFADMLDADKDNIDASKVPTEMSTIDYVYDVEYKDGSQDKGAFEFTKKGKLTGLPHAIANSEDTYVLKNSDGIEHIDIWGVEPGSNKYNNGVFLNDMTISTIGKQSIKGYQDASGNPIVGMTVGNDASGNGIKVILDKVDSVTGFSTAFKVQESGSLSLTDTSVFGNVGNSSLADIELSDNALLTVKDTDSTDGYNTKIGKVLGKDDNTSSLVLSGNISAETISNVNTLLENDSLLTITDAGLLDLANKTIILKGNANVTVDNPMTVTSRLVLKNSVVDMADDAKTINRIESNELTLEDEVNLSFNVDLSSNKVDKITYNTLHTDNLTSVNIKDISILNDAINTNDTVIFAPIDGLQKGTSTDLSYYYNSNALGYILGTYYFYTLGVKDEINKDSTLSQEYLVLTRTGKTNFDRLLGLEEAIAKGENSFVMTEDEVIEEWLGYEDVNGGFSTEGGKLKDDIVILGNGFDIKGQDNKGLYVGLNKELTLDDVANLGGFVSPDWEGGSIHNEGTTKVFANNSDVNFGLSTDSTGYNAIYNTGDLYLTTDKDSSITFVDNASITGTSTGIGTIYTNGNVNLDNVSNNNIVAQNGTLSIKDLTLDKQTSLITQKGQVPFGDKDGVEISIDNIIATDTTNIDLRNDNSSDSLVVDKLQGDSNLALDASLSGKGTIDKVNISNLDGKLTISSDGLNVISDMDLTNQKVLLNPFEGMNSVDISKIEVNVPNLISTENYQYKVSYGSKNDGEFIFTKFGKLTGFADAIAKAKNEYLFTSDEAIDIWGVEKDGKYNNGTTLDNIVVNGQGYNLTGVTSNEGQAIKGLTVSKNTEVSFNDFNKISGFKGDNGAFEIDGTLNLNISVDNFTTEITDNGSVGMINHGNLNISTTGSSIYKIDSNVSSKIDNANGAISISGSADDVVTEDITKASGVTFTSKVSNQNVTVNKGGRLNVGSLTSFENSNLIVNDGGHFNVGISNVKFDNVTFNEGSKLSMRIDNSNSYGTITATNNFTISDGSNFNLLIGKNAIEKGQSENFQLFIRESDLNYAVEDNFNLNFKNNMYVITQIGNGWYRVNYGLSGEQIAAENGGSKSTQLTARAWTDGEEIQANTNALASEIQTKLYETAQLDGKKYVEDLNSLMPSAAPIVQLTERQIATSMFNAASERGGNTAFATSNNMDVNINHNLSYWLDIGGSITDFKPSRFSDVDMSAYRISSGIDYHQNGGYFGVGYMYHVHDIDAYMRNIEAKSNTAMIYGGYDHDKFFVDAVFGYTNTKYDEHKSVYDKDISADYSADSLNASLKGGVKVKASEAVTIKPTVAVKNYNIKRHAYTDTLEQKVDNQDMTVVTTEIGADFLYKDKSVETNLGLYYGYDVKTDNESYNVDILNGSSYNAKAAKLGKHSGIVDVGINYKPSDNSKVGIGYEGNFRKDYINHSAKFELEVNF